MELPTTDVKLLQHNLRDTTERLQRAAHLGLQLSQQNDHLRQQLQQLTSAQHDLQQRIQLLERDRKWQHSQSLVVDQNQQALEEMQKQQSTVRQQQAAQEKRIRQMEEARLNEPPRPVGDSQIQLSRIRGMVERQMGGMETQLGELKLRIDALGDKLSLTQRQLSGYSQQSGSSLNKLSSRLDLIQSDCQHTGHQLADLTTHHQDLHDAFRQTLSEYAHFTAVEPETSSQGETLADILPSEESPRQAFNQIISPTASVGVGWGRYWEARRLGFDIQKQLKCYR